ncbi:MAG TPA: ATP-dependent zinc metalloprotease FtsH [Isosphaeraceae bacterium]|jgi:cell division protease FtsH|nr:ATP-dependent zinc metalloprotease FtsH [Isosphaeraceae bacterium]
MNSKPRFRLPGLPGPFPKKTLVAAGVAVVAIVAAVATMAWRRWPESPRPLAYGQFEKKLVEGGVARVKIAPGELSGELVEKVAGKAVRFRTPWPNAERDERLAGLLAKHVPGGNYEADAGPSAGWSSAATLGILIALVATFVVLSRMGGVGSVVAFGKSRHKLYERQDDPVTFDDVAGIDEAVGELREVVEFLRRPEKYQALGGRIPKGILLVGPPGTGKTLLAKAVAGEAGVPFFSLSGSDFVEMFAGVGAARVRNLFAQAESKAPSLIFIDELDAIGKARSAGGVGHHDERDQTLNQLLVAMDGFASNRGIIVMAATNRPETLDAALVRPGRFDRNIVVDRPDLVGREQILKVHARNVPIGEGLDLRQIAAMTPGFVGADLANLVNEAALLAARKNKSQVDRHDFEEGVERVVAGPEKRQRVIRRDEQLRIAHHEAGHALVARSLPGTDPVHKVSIVGRGAGMGGFTMYRPEDDRFLHTQSWLIDHIRTLLGGTVAEELTYGEVSDGATSDLQRATQVARKMVAEFGMSPRLGRVSYQTQGRSPFLPGGGANDSSWSERTAREIDLEVRRILDDALRSTRELLERRRPALEAVADALMERETIDAAQLQEILDRFPDAP